MNVDRHIEPPLRKAIAFLERHGYRYAVIGGVALAHWGIVRATYDVDLRVYVPDFDLDRIRSEIRLAFPERARPHAPDNAFIVAVNIDGVIVDFLLALPGYEGNIVEHATQADFGGWSVWVCSAEDLIIQKVVAGRSKDWPDVEGLLIEQWDNLDHPYIGNWLGQFAEALENPELLDQYHQVQQRVESLRNSA
jgi:hypothetical protein